VDEMARDLILN